MALKIDIIICNNKDENIFCQLWGKNHSFPTSKNTWAEEASFRSEFVNVEIENKGFSVFAGFDKNSNTFSTHNVLKTSGRVVSQLQ